MTIGRDTRSLDDMIVREQIANRKKHWVRAVTACNSKCLFCLDSDTPATSTSAPKMCRRICDEAERNSMQTR
jgi:hypothetical protein